MSQNDDENADLPVAEAGKDPRPPDNSSLKNESDGSHIKPPKGESPKEGKMKSAKEYMTSVGGWINENKNVFIFAAFLIAFLLWNPILLDSTGLISAYAIVVAMIVLLMKPPFGFSKFLVRAAAIVAILGIVFFTWGSALGLSLNGRSNGITSGIVVPAAGSSLETRVTALEDNQNKVIVPALNVYAEALKLLGRSVDSLTPRVEKLEKKADIPVSTAPKAEKKVEALLGSSSSLATSSSDSYSTTAKISTGVAWKSWKNTTGSTLYARLFGVYWPAGGSATIVEIPDGKGLVADGINLLPGDHLVLYGLHNDGKDYTWEQVEANPSLGRYYNVDGSIVRFGYERAMIVVDSSGNLRSGLAIKQGEAMNVNLERRPPQGRITVAIKTFDGEVVPTRNFEK